MTNLDHCRCGRHGKHATCLPKWDIHDTEYHRGEAPSDDDFEYRTLYGVDAEDVAEQFARKFDAQGDYECINGSKMTLLIHKADDDSGTWNLYTVRGETVAEYYVTEGDRWVIPGEV